MGKERVVRLNVTSREPYLVQVKGEEQPRKLSVREPRALAAFKRLQKELGGHNVSLIPPAKVRQRIAAEFKAKQERFKTRSS